RVLFRSLLCCRWTGLAALRMLKEEKTLFMHGQVRLIIASSSKTCFDQSRSSWSDLLVSVVGMKHIPHVSFGIHQHVTMPCAGMMKVLLMKDGISRMFFPWPEGMFADRVANGIIRITKIIG